MTKVRLIGDIHGNMDSYKELIQGCYHSIQLGDFGLGWIPLQAMFNYDSNLPFHKFFCGNHDDRKTAEELELKRYLSSGPSNQWKDVFILGGAWSIDQEWRTPGFDWWPEEEHSQEELDRLVEQYCEIKPKIVLSHDCPQEAWTELFAANPNYKGFGPRFWRQTRTGEALTRMFRLHQPEQWWFGHHHCSAEEVINGTYFRCLNIEETAEIELEEL